MTQAFDAYAPTRPRLCRSSGLRGNGLMQLDGSAVGADELATLALYNYGHFTTILVHDMKVRGLGLHMQRLVDDSTTLHGMPVDPDRVRDLVRKALADGP